MPGPKILSSEYQNWDVGLLMKTPRAEPALHLSWSFHINRFMKGPVHSKLLQTDKMYCLHCRGKCWLLASNFLKGNRNTWQPSALLLHLIHVFFLSKVNTENMYWHWWLQQKTITGVYLKKGFWQTCLYWKLCKKLNFWSQPFHLTNEVNAMSLSVSNAGWLLLFLFTACTNFISNGQLQGFKPFWVPCGLGLYCT